jgi:hypothetical protein
MNMDEAKKKLSDAAKWHVEEPDSGPRWAALCEAAVAFANLREALKPTRVAPRSDKPASGECLPRKGGGGPPIEEAETKDLEYWIGRFEGELDSPDKAKWRDANLARLEKFRAELESR